MPTPSVSRQATQQYKRRRHRRNAWFLGLDRFMAVVALVNLTLVLFNITYIPLRDFYLSQLPAITELYDPIKGIEPYWDTQQYLQSVDQVEQELAQSGPQGAKLQKLLAKLRDQSEAMINQNPFELAQKTGTLEKIKNRMRKHMDNESAQGSLREFWSVDHLQKNLWTGEIKFFNAKIRPLIASNYYRPFGESGDFVDYFVAIDFPFVILFGLDYLIRTFYLSRRRPGISWRDTLLWRWYDLFFFLPIWRILRILPIMLRLHQVGWINLSRVQTQINRFLAESLARDMTEIVLVQSVSVAQDAIAQGVVAQWLLQSETDAVEINEVNELQELIVQAVKITIYKVLPQLQPDVENVIRHAISEALSDLPLYRQVQQLPGMTALPNAIAQQVTQRLTQTTQSTITKILQDQKGRDIFEQLGEHFTDALRTELKDETTLAEIQALLLDFLEETKLTILQRLEAKSDEGTTAEIERLRQVSYESKGLASIQVIPGSANKQ
ncbi:MAG: hypothetical protein HC851_16715 [Acaryochloris sp. RU_4_1]|nr:hypothetical protein [Acaryochloris sp. RU_4_1]NJR54712.1 hypothetical protein [Acaryochloris sp. CRU_2_0]